VKTRSRYVLKLCIKMNTGKVRDNHFKSVLNRGCRK